MRLLELANDYRAAERAYLEAKESFYAGIREAHASGRSLRDIGREVDLSAARVQKIVAR